MSVLTFTPENWETWQHVVLTVPVPDARTDNESPRTATIQHLASTNATEANLAGDLLVVVRDDIATLSVIADPAEMRPPGVGVAWRDGCADNKRSLPNGADSPLTIDGCGTTARPSLV